MNLTNSFFSCACYPQWTSCLPQNSFWTPLTKSAGSQKKMQVIKQTKLLSLNETVFEKPFWNLFFVKKGPETVSGSGRPRSCQRNCFRVSGGWTKNLFGWLTQLVKQRSWVWKLLSGERGFRKSTITPEPLGLQKRYCTFWKWEGKPNSKRSSASS